MYLNGFLRHFALQVKYFVFIVERLSFSASFFKYNFTENHLKTYAQMYYSLIFRGSIKHRINYNSCLSSLSPCVVLFAGWLFVMRLI